MIWVWGLMPALAMGDDDLPGKWWRMPDVSRMLDLNDGQVNQLDNLYTDNRGRLMSLKDSVERERLQLDEIMESEPFNEAAVMAQLRKLESVRGSLASERFRYVMEVRKMLGRERFNRLKGYMNKPRIREDRRPRRRPGSGLRPGPFSMGFSVGIR